LAVDIVTDQTWSIYCQIHELEALGHCIPLPRHVLPVSRYGSGSLSRLPTKI